MVREQTHQSTRTLPVETSIGAVHLKVSSLAESLVFYRDILGYHATEPDDRKVVLSSPDGHAHFVLREIDDAVPAGFRSSGLFHAAILLPRRSDLALVTQRLVNSGWDIGGASDHGVSEALYLNDPDNNGLEIYVDYPRAQWPMQGDRVQMVTERLDFESLFGELAGQDLEWQGIPDGTTIGHVHLKVGDLNASQRFYVDVLGFNVMQDTYPGALFVAAGGYHHHVGMNVWAGQGVPAPPDNAVGLERFAVVLPDDESLASLANQLHESGVPVGDTSDRSIVVHDPDGIEIELRAQAR